MKNSQELARTRKNSKKSYLGIILLVLTCIIGLKVYDDYSISWDENDQVLLGKLNYKYVFSDNKNLLKHRWNFYGIGFEIPLVIITKILNIKDTRTLFLMRHLVTHLFFLISAFCGFLLIDFLYKNKVLASIGFLLIVLHPRLYAHSFFNPKDIPFMSMFLICLYLNALAFEKRQVKNFILLGIGVGFLINMRIVGVMLFCLVLFFLTIDLIYNKEKSYLINIKAGLVFIFTACTTLYTTWPYLWTNPLKNFVTSFLNMSKFIRYNHSVLFKGKYIKAQKLSWDYIPTWFSITTPIFYLMAGLLGLIALSLYFFKKPSLYLSNCKERNNLFFLICFLAPIVAVIVLHSVLYDGWRHLFFIYPSFVLLCIYGLNFLYQKGMKKLVVTGAFLAFTFTVIFMVKNHPFQQVYFNNLVDTKSPEYLRKNFEFDYWGASYKQALEYILKNDSSPSIKVAVANFPGVLNRQILIPKERKRIKIVIRKEKAKYFITNYRCHSGDYKELKKFKWHSIKVGNNTINAIFKLK